MTPASRDRTPPHSMTRGFVMAGGRSARMGRDKALLPYSGGTLLDHAISRLRLVIGDVRVLCGPTRRYEDCGVPVIEDAICGAGPLSGLYSALLSASIDGVERILWLAIDVPLVEPSFLARLVDTLDGAEVAMARTPTGSEPLCAAFRTDPTLDVARRSLLRGNLKLTEAIEGLNVSFIDGDAAAFANINTVADYRDLSGASR